MKNRTSLILCVCSIFIITGCSSTPTATQSAEPVSTIETSKLIYMNNTIQYSDKSMIKEAILNECDLNTKFLTFILSYATENGLSIELTDNTTGKIDADILHVEIKDAVSGGNAFIGHRKFTSVKGSLSRNGSEIASFTGMRRSGGGAFAGYKSSCAVLGRTVKALGKDVATWLNNPVTGAKLGDLR